MHCRERDEEAKLREYFLGRALALLEEAKRAEGEERYDLEQRIAGYWRIARGDPEA
jgi:hypothetical protein